MEEKIVPSTKNAKEPSLSVRAAAPPAIVSMTGFGAAEAETAIGRIAVEVRSVNNRFLDLSIRSPREFNPAETRLRALVKTHLNRGKVDLNIRWEMLADLAPKLQIDEKLFESYARQIQALQVRLSDTGPLPVHYLLNLPGVAAGAGGPQLQDEALWGALAPVVAEALRRLAAERRREGEALAADMRERLAEIARETASLESAKSDVSERYRQKLRQRVEEWKAQGVASVDDGRIETEVMFYADRADITEELVRLRAHLERFTATLDTPRGPAGKDLDFLTQELLREVNTIGSKGRETAVSASVLAMKAAVEKIREQVQNIE